jgi:diamine N-acetyltransferase
MVVLAPVTSDNGRDLARLRAADHQREGVADVTYYLCLSAYDGVRGRARCSTTAVRRSGT